MSFDVNSGFVTGRTAAGGETIPFDLRGGIRGGSLVYAEDFSAINPSVWDARSGEYRGWVYLPADYSGNAGVQNGVLTVSPKKDSPYTGYQWSSAFLHTQDKFEFQRGIVAAKVRFPTVANYHATLWMLGADGPGEIDIAEADNGNVSCNLHYYDADGSNHTKVTIGTYRFTADAFNEFMLLWTEDTIKCYCNGEAVGGFDIAEADRNGYNSFDQPFYLVFNALPLSVASEAYATVSTFDVQLRDLIVYGEDVEAEPFEPTVPEEPEIEI